MRLGQLVGAFFGLVSILALSGTSVATPGEDHGPPPGKGPKSTPTARATPHSEGGDSGHGHGKGSCVSACAQANRDCVKNTSGARKDCYRQTCASQLAAVQACNSGGGGSPSGDGVSDQNGGCDKEAAALRQCLQTCRTSSTTARKACAATAVACKGSCGLPNPSPEPTATATEAPTP